MSVRWSYIFMLMLMVGVSAPAGAVVYNVRKDGTGDYTTIQACADDTVAGDTCLVAAGDYGERVTVTNSGTAAARIRFQGQGGVRMGGFYLNQADHITIDGFEIITTAGSTGGGVNLAGADFAEITRNNIHHNVGRGIFMSSLCNDVWIASNTIAFPDFADGIGNDSAGIQVRGSRLLIENNDISHVGDFTRVWGSNIVIRDNYFHDIYRSDYPLNPGTDGTGHHVDGIQTWSTPGEIPARHVLMENNRMINNNKTHSHFGILQDEERVGHRYFIVRYNVARTLGESTIGSDDGVRDVAVYNNTFVDVGAWAGDPWAVIGFSNDAQGSSVVNNIFYNASRTPRGEVTDFDSSAEPFYADYNLAYDPDCDSSCDWQTGPYKIGGEDHPLLDVNPQLDADFNLQDGSGAIDGGGPLTRVATNDSGTGTTLVLQNATLFQAGMDMTARGVQPDWIAIGNPGNAAKIVSIDYQTNSITLATAITRSDNDPVWLYRDSHGRQVLMGAGPDVGAREFDGPVTPTAPAITAQPQNRTVTAGQTATFSVAATGYPAPAYAWRKDGVALSNGGRISGATSAALNITNTVTGDAGIYSCFVSNSEGDDTSSGATLTVVSVSDIVPEDRIVDWTKAGVPGGIPNRASICSTPQCAALTTSAYGHGNVDATAAVNAAIQSCPANQVVLIPEGNYLLNGAVNFNGKSRVTLRGAGPGRTVLRPHSYAAITSGQMSNSAERAITGGATKGNRFITVSDASNILPQTLIHIYQENDPDFVWNRWGDDDDIGQYANVIAVSGNTLELEDPLAWTFDRNPRFRCHVAPHIKWSGIEDLSIVGDQAFTGSMISLWNSYACWIRNVETAWGDGNEHLFLYGSLRCEIRDSFIHDTYSTTDGYGLVTAAGSAERGHNTGILVENNIFSGFFAGMVLETDVASVFAYNYLRNSRYMNWPTNQVADINANHGAHGMMNLFEGNVGAGGFISDGYHGSSSHFTLFRNAFTGKHVDPAKTGNRKPVDLTRYSYYSNVVGNVLGDASWTPTGYEMTGEPGYDQQQVIYRLGYPNVGNNGLCQPGEYMYDDVGCTTQFDGGTGHGNAPGWQDLKTDQTLLRWGNYDYFHRAARWEVSERPDGVDASHVLPASFYRDARPAWFASAAWPPIGPDAPNLVNVTPAQICYENGPALGRQFNATSCYYGAPWTDPVGGEAVADAAHFLPFKNLFNPTQETLTIRFAPAGAELVIYDRKGREVRQIQDATQDGSALVAVWDGRNAEGKVVASGVYLAILRQGSAVAKRKIVVVK
jgi:hypothetical protein